MGASPWRFKSSHPHQASEQALSRLEVPGSDRKPGRRLERASKPLVRLATGETRTLGLRRLACVVLLILALAASLYGAWLIASEDVQGGRDIAGSAWLVAGVVAALLAVWMLRGGRR